MKHRYITPDSIVLPVQLSYALLEDSSLVDYYGGEDASVTDGNW